MHPFLKSNGSNASNSLSWVLIVVFSVWIHPGSVTAATFAARVSPPNFELKARPGDVVRQVITIGNEDSEPAHYQIRTADWTLDENGGVTIAPADQPLDPTSCRSWTRIERRSVKLAAKAVKQFRFEVHVPENASDGQCRFAVLIAPSQETVDALAFGSFKFPVAGAIAVIVYVTVGDAAPELEFNGMFRNPSPGKTGPVLRFTNHGNAHARPFGSIRVEDNTGKKAELIVVPFPILPGAVRDVELMVDQEISGLQSLDELVYPLELKGVVEWDGGTYRPEGTLQ
jgi:hypothetical protein